MFFGTPHKGSDAATWAQIGTKIVAMAKLDALEHLSGSLKLDSEILNNVHSDFMKLLHGGAFYIHVFQEARPMGKGMKKVYYPVPTLSKSALIQFSQIVSDLSSKIENAPHCQHEMIDGNHRSMIRYRTADAPGYRQVVSALKHYMKKLDKAHDIERACKAPASVP